MTNCFSAHERVKHQIHTRVSAETVRHDSTYIILFLTWHDETINDDKNNDLYTPSRCLTSPVVVCRWRHKRLLMTSQLSGNYNMITWIMLSNSLDIGFIHGDIHGRSCKNYISPTIGYLWLWWVLEIALQFINSARIVFGFSWHPNSAEQHMLQVNDGANVLNIYEIKR